METGTGTGEAGCIREQEVGAETGEVGTGKGKWQEIGRAGTTGWQMGTGR